MKDRSIDGEQVYPKNLKAKRFSDRTVTVRWSLFWAFAVLIILISGTTLTISLVGTSRLVDNVARSIIDRTQKQTEVELHRLFDPIVQQVAIAHRWVKNGLVKCYDTNALNALFLPGMFHLPQCVSMMVSDMTGYEFTIFRNESGGQLETPVGQVQWVTRDFRPEQWGRKSIWTLWDENGSKKVKQWKKDTVWDADLVREFAPSGTKVNTLGEKGLVYDPRPRVWHKGPRDRYREWTTAEIIKNHQEAIYWTDIDMFFTSKAPGLTASIAVKDPEGELVVIGYDLLLRDLSIFTTALQPTEHGKVFVFTETGQIVGLPRDRRLQDERLMSAALLKPVESAGIPELATCMKYWRARLSDELAPFRFEGGGQAWWVGFRPFRVSAERRLWIGVAVPESDFLAVARQNQFVILVIGVAALALATILAGRLSRSFARPLQALVNKSRHIAALDLTSVKCVVSRLTEIEQLSYSLEEMRSSLENHITQRNEAEQALQKARDGLELRVEGRTAELKKANDELKREITERKRAEEALKESEQKFRSLVETTSDWVWEVNQKGAYTYASPKVEDLLGYGPEEVIGKTPFDLMPPVEAEQVAGLFRDIVKSRKPFAGLENTNLHKNGKRVVLETSGIPILDADGNLLGYRGIDRDITERMQAEQEIHSLARFPSENPYPILRIAKDNTVLYANCAGSELLRDWGCEVGTRAPEHWHQYISRILNSGLSDEFEIVSREKNFSLIIAPIVDAGYVNIYGIDITERKAAEEDLREYRQHLEELVQARTAELTQANKKLLQEIEQRKRLEKEILSISERERRRLGQELHDSLGQQLTGISFMAKVLEQKLASRLPNEASGAAEIAKLVRQATGQARGLAKGLHPIDLDASSLMLSLQELAATTENLFGVRCTFKCDKPVKIDDTDLAVHLYRITQEAITNAIRHSRAKNIQIGLSHGTDKSVLTVRSDGLGFPKSQAKSTGMGLQIMNHRAEMIGSTLDIRRGSKGGTLVICAFPNKKYQQR